MYECKECGKPVEIVDGQPVRSCEHHDAPIVANLEATVYGEAGIK